MSCQEGEVRIIWCASMNNEFPAKCRLSLLGRFELIGPDGRVDLPSKKLAGLLAYLACTAPEPQPREKLATLLWGSHFEAQARQNLRQALSRLRRTLGQDALLSDGEKVSLAPGAVDCDATRLEALIREGSRDLLSAAANLYKGQLLADLTVTEAAWAEWVAEEQRRLEGLALDAMIRLGELEGKSGMHDLALAAASRAISINNLREDAHRVAIRALAGAGRRADALKRYEDLAKQLKSELDVEPDTLTKALELELRKSQLTAAPLAERVAPPGEVADLPPLPDRPSIAVLPFANLSGDPEQEYFADGMVDDILMALSRVRWLFVIARQSSFIYKVRAADVQQIGRELGVRYVVEGSVRKSGNRVRIVAQLIETESGAHIWADRYDGDLRDIFALQDAITEQIVSAVEMNVQAAEIKRARAGPTDNLTAYDLYLRALPAYFGQTEIDYRRTQVLLSKALEGDPEYAEAIGTLTDSVAVRTLLGWHESWSGGVHEASQLADRAVAVAPDNSTCVASAAFTYGVLSRRFDEAFDLANRAVTLHPNSVLVRYRAGAVYAVCGEPDKAIAQCEAASRMNPLASKKTATATFSTLSCALYFAGRFEECVHAGRRALALAPQDTISRKYVAMSLGQLGRTRDAQIEIAELVKRQTDASIALFQQQGFRHKWMRELHVEGLRKAGLREK